jgi:hypothetical protein
MSVLTWPKKGPISEIYEQYGTNGGKNAIPEPIRELLEQNGIPESDFIAFWRIAPGIKKTMLNQMKFGAAVSTLFLSLATFGVGAVCLPCTGYGYLKEKSVINSCITILTKTKIIRYWHREVGCGGCTITSTGRDIDVIDLNTVLSVNVDAKNKGICHCFNWGQVKLEIMGRNQMVVVNGNSYSTGPFTIPHADPQQVARVLRETKDALMAGGPNNGARGVPMPATSGTAGHPASSNAVGPSSMQQLQDLKSLYEAGILSEQEYSTKKQDILVNW